MVEISLNLFTAAFGLMSWQDRLVKHLSSFYYHIYFSKMTNSIITITLLIYVTVSVKKRDMVNYEKRSTGEIRELAECMRCSLKCTDIALYKTLHHFAISKRRPPRQEPIPRRSKMQQNYFNGLLQVHEKKNDVTFCSQVRITQSGVFSG